VTGRRPKTLNDTGRFGHKRESGQVRTPSCRSSSAARWLIVSAKTDLRPVKVDYGLEAGIAAKKKICMNIL
jgi:hypothetical protein